MGQVTGRDHLLRRVNCQDSVGIRQLETAVIGIVCDGCGSGKHSEVGAKLVTEYLLNQAEYLLDEGVTLDALPRLLYAQTLTYLDGLLSTVDATRQLEFINDYLLFTIQGVIITGAEGVIFSAGDGMVLVNEDLQIRDEDNQPNYIAYHLIDPRYLNGDVLPETFDYQLLANDWQRLAIATDGFEPELFHDIWGFRNPRVLQRKMNVWSDREHRFKDDATIITIERRMRDASAS